MREEEVAAHRSEPPCAVVPLEDRASRRAWTRDDSHPDVVLARTRRCLRPRTDVRATVSGDARVVVEVPRALAVVREVEIARRRIALGHGSCRLTVEQR